MKTNTMNGRILLASAAIVLGSIGAAEVLKPAEAHAAGAQLSQAQTSPADVARGMLPGLNLDAQVKTQVKEQFRSLAKGDAKLTAQYETLLEQIDTGKVDPDPKAEQFTPKSYEQILDQAKADYDRVKKTQGGAFTNDYNLYLSDKGKYAYTPFEKLNAELMKSIGGAQRIGAGFPELAAWAGWATAASSADWAAITISTSGLLGQIPGATGNVGFVTGLWGPAWDLYNAALTGDVAQMAVAIVALHVAAATIAFPPAALVGMVIGVVGLIVSIFKQEASPNHTDVAREARDKAWRANIENVVKKVIAPKIDLERQRVEQQGMYATALAEVAIDEINNSSTSKKTASQIAEYKNGLRQELKKGTTELAKKFREMAPAAAARETKEFITGKAKYREEDGSYRDYDATKKRPIGTDPKKGEVLPELAKAGIKTVNAVLTVQGQLSGSNTDTSWIFSGDQVAKIRVEATGEIKIVESLRPLKDVFGGWVSRGIKTPTAIVDSRRATTEWWVIDANNNKMITVNANGDVMKENPAVWEGGQAGESYRGVVPGYYRDVAQAGYYDQFNRSLVMTRQGVVKEVEFSKQNGRDYAKIINQKVDRIQGLEQSGILQGFTAFVPIQTTGLGYAFNDKGEVATIVKRADSMGTAPSDAFARFTQSFLQNYKNKPTNLDDWNGVVWSLLQDKVTDSGRMPSDKDLSMWGASRGAAMYIPEIGLRPGSEVLIGGVHTTDMNLAEVGSAVKQQDQGYSTKARTWTLRDAGSGKFRVESKWSGNCLVLGTTQKAEIGGCNTQASVWEITSTHNGFKLQSSGTAQVLDVPGSSQDNGTQPGGWNWNGGANQRFRITPATHIYSGKTYTMEDQEYMANADLNEGNGTVNANQDKHRRVNQQWTVLPTGRTASYDGKTLQESLLRNGTGQCLTRGYDTYRWSFVTTCDPDQSDQRWLLRPQSERDELVRITHVQSGYALQNQAKNGITQVYPELNQNNQKWWLNPIKNARPMSVLDASGTTTRTTTTVNSSGNGYTAKPGDVLGKDGQEGLRGTVLRDGNPAEGVQVEFAVPEDSGLYFDQDGQHVTKAVVTTGANGEATAPLLHAGEKEGDYTVTMTAIDETGAQPGTYTVHVKA